MTGVSIDKDKRYLGRIIHVNKEGFGFISCKEIPFTRIFFHWTALLPETIHFTELKEKDEVYFNAIEYFDRKINDTTIRAIKVDVLEPEVKE